MSDPRYPDLYERDEARKSKAGPVQLLLTGALGFLLPIRHTGKLYLVRELQGCGIDTSLIPEACLQELTDEAIRQCKEQSRFEGRSWRAVIVQDIEQIALLIACRLDGDNIFMSAMSWPIPFVEIIRKYGLLPNALGKHAPPAVDT